MTHAILELLGQFPGFYQYFIAFTLIFARLLAFFMIAPIFKRKEVPNMAKIGFAMMLSYILMTIIKLGDIPQDVPYMFLLFANITTGYFIGLICRFIFQTIQAAGDMANNQMALSSASTFDPSTKVQTSIIGRLLGLFAVVVFINIGGIYWLITAFHRSFEIFPVFSTVPQLIQNVTLDYFIYISGNIIFVGFQMVAPVIITTLAIDIILGIISKTAPQINVFQLSFVFKPCVGTMVLLATFPIFMRILEDYFMSHATFF